MFFCRFETEVIPRQICIYETYNPGSVVRIWAQKRCCGKIKWIVLWEGLPEISTISRTFSPLLRKVHFLTKY